jgi:putative ABC transport system substrate-binding protein
MRRREFVTWLGSATAWPFAARAQRQPPMPVVGYLGGGRPEPGRQIVAAVHRGLSEMGYVEGKNLTVEYRWAEDRLDRLPALAEDLVRRQVAVIVVTSAAAVFAAKAAAKAAAKSVPIAFTLGVDPVESGLVASLSRPGGDLTGVYNLQARVAAKRFELLHELLLGAATSIGVLVNPINSVITDPEIRELQTAARTLGMQLLVLNASDPSEFESAFAMLVRERAGGLVVGGDAFFFNHYHELVALAARYRVPAIYVTRGAAAVGGLLSYGTDYPHVWRQVGIYAGRILKGEKPADLPVQQVTKVELVINLKTAKALGLDIPLTLIGRADEVIE